MLGRIRRELFLQHTHLGSFLLRVGLAIIFVYHGYLKLAQSGGHRWHDNLPEAEQLAVAWGEFLCGLALLFGLLSRLAAVGLIVIMVGAIMLQTGRFDFIYIETYGINNPGKLPTGTEYNFAIITMCLGVVALGSGKVSLDHLIFGKWIARMTAPASLASVPHPAV